MKPHHHLTFLSTLVFAQTTIAADINSIAGGEWTTPATWSDNAAPSAGSDYFVKDTFTVDSPVAGSGTSPGPMLTFGGDSITVESGGTLRLRHTNAGGNAFVQYDLKSLTLGNGATLQSLNTSTGNVTRNLNNPITTDAAGTVNLRIQNASGSAWTNHLYLNGALSGGADINFTGGLAGQSGNRRILRVTSADNAFSGNWTVTGDGGDDSRRLFLEANAANALGTGTVTLGNRSHLRGNAANSLDSLSGIILTSPTSTLSFNNHDWTNKDAVFSISDGVANVGTAHIDIESIQQTAGTINLNVGGSKDGKLITSGDADFEGGALNIIFGGSPDGKTFDLVTYGGELLNPPNITGLDDTGRLTASVDNGTLANDKVTLSFTGSVANLVWTGDEPGFENDWDNDLALNFDNDGTPDTFRQFDHVLFGNTSGSTTPNIIGTLTPSSVTFDHSSNDYTLGGAGSLTGSAGITKSGTGTLTINGAHTITGQSALNDGRLRISNNAALGTGTLTINGGALSSNGATARDLAAAVVIADSFILGDTADTGAMNLAGPVTLAGNAKVTVRSATPTTVNGTISGTGNLELERPDSSIARWNLANTANDFEGNITITSGRLWFAPGGTGDASLGNPSNKIIFNGEPTVTFVNNEGRASIQQSSGVAVTLAATREVIINDGKEGTFHTWGGQNFTVHAPISGGGRLRKEDSGTLILTADNTYSGGTAIVLGQVTVTSNTAFGTGPVEFQHSASSTSTTRVNLTNVTLANDFVLNTNAQTGFRGPINTGAANTLSTLSGTITVQSAVGNGGHISSLDGGVLRLTGTINTTGPLPNIRSGVVEMGTTGGNLTALAHGEGTLRLVANNGIQPTVELRLALSSASTLDLNGFDQTLAQIKRNVPDQTTGTSFGATITNTAATPSVFTIDGSVNHAFSGTINNGTGGISLVKKGSSTFTLNGAHTYTGDTTVEAGTLSLNNAYLEDGSAIRVTTGATLDLTHGATDTVAELWIDGVQQPADIYDADNSSFITGTGALNVTSGSSSGDPFDNWAATAGLDGTPGKEAGFDDDPDGDGVANGLEWILGGNPLDGQGGGLVTTTATAAGGLTLGFTREPESIGEATLMVEYNTNLGATWESVSIGANSSGPDANGVTVDIDTAEDPHAVTINIPASNAPGGKLFARLKATKP